MPHEPKPDAVTRRRFLTVLGASGAGTVALSGCSTDRVEKLVPYLVQSEDQVPGLATWYASTCTECPAGCGLHVRTREGRAVKLEGNPDHPINRGKLCSRGQAALQGLYNPGRVKAPRARNAAGALEEITWEDAIGRLAAKLGGAAGKVAVISGAGRGTLSDLLADWTAALGGRVVRYQALDQEPLRAANQALFGRPEVPAFDFARARFILSFGADFLETWLAPVENQRGFAESHGFNGGATAKHVFFGPRMSLTAMNADEWHPIAPGSEAALALAIAHLLVTEHGRSAAGVADALAAHTPEAAEKESGVPAATIRRIAREVAEARPSLAVAGGVSAQHRGAVELAAAVNLLNYVAGNVGETVLFGADLDGGDGAGALDELGRALDAGQVAVLLVHEANPVYTMPAASGFTGRFRKAGYKVSTSSWLDETAAECDLLLPNHHALERWDDARPRAGVHGLMQPVMQPVFTTMNTGDVLLQVAKKAGGALAKFDAPSYEAHLKSRWQALAGERAAAGGFDDFWRAALARGGLYGERPAAPAVSLALSLPVRASRPALEGDGEFSFVPHATSFLYDGRGTNKPWLLENPDPVTKLTWHHWVEVHPDTARRLDVRNGEVVRLASPHGAIEAPVLVFPGIRRDVVSVPLGFGHTAYGEFTTARGANALDLLPGPAGQPFVPYVAVKVSLEKTGVFRDLATTEGNPRQLGRGIAEAMPLAAAVKGLTVRESYELDGRPPHEVNTERELEAIAGWAEGQHIRTRRGDYARENPQWGMAIDLSRCTGCSACVTACYAENNIATVGEADVLRGREMTWMRLERYWEGGEGAPPLEARFVPMLCQHCGNAPCEPVCPVYAAYHTADGLNGQIYNRCVGTRYCANNCPYKVRYFNWYKYSERSWPEPLQLQLNPDVTVRARGVMEKCTFCIQRIRGAQNQARLEGRPLRDGEFTTACAQACPSDAIVFGDMNDPGSRVNQVKRNHRAYHVLEETNVRPAVTYLAKVVRRGEA
ncbi:MAG TPA: 4Fe-4S dicluster domain-containing protein [Gemmatimonadales bacterium]|nr:4Fe-4S dicluster domain-containing protein [Gemmatimonadales bacterium]